MRLAVIWQKALWPSLLSPSGYSCPGSLGHPGFGGIAREVESLSALFDATRILGPCEDPEDRTGEAPIDGRHVSVVPVDPLPRSPSSLVRRLGPWLVRNAPVLRREVAAADAVLTFVPSPIGWLGLLLALAYRKPLLVRTLNEWANPSLAWRLERAFLERIAGGRTVVFASGMGDEPLSRPSAIGRLFVTVLTDRELAAESTERPAASASGRLVVLGREIDTREMTVVLGALPLLAQRFPDAAVDVVGDVPASAEPAELARALGVADRVIWHGSPDRARVTNLLRAGDVYCTVSAAETGPSRHALHEALAAGLPVVTARTESARALARRGCAIVLEQNTAAALADGVRACLADPARYRRMSAAACATARAYSLEAWRDRVQMALHEAWGPLAAPTAARPRPAEAMSR